MKPHSQLEFPDRGNYTIQSWEKAETKFSWEGFLMRISWDSHELSTLVRKMIFSPVKKLMRKSHENVIFSWESHENLTRFLWAFSSHEKNEILMSKKPRERFSWDLENSHENVIFSWESHEILMRIQKLMRIFVRVSIHSLHKEHFYFSTHVSRLLHLVFRAQKSLVGIGLKPVWQPSWPIHLNVHIAWSGRVFWYEAWRHYANGLLSLNLYHSLLHFSPGVGLNGSWQRHVWNTPAWSSEHFTSGWQVLLFILHWWLSEGKTRERKKKG